MIQKHLSIRITIVLIVLLNVASVTLAIYGITKQVLLPSYISIENEEALRNLDRANDALVDILDGLRVTVSDWSTWDDPYAFAQGTNDSFAETDLTTLAMKNLNINALIFTNSTKEIVFKRGFDTETEADMPLDALTSYFTSQPARLDGALGSEPLSGIIQTPHDPFLIVAHPITRSDGSGPVAGVLIFGKVFNESMRTSLEELTHLSIQLFPYDSTSLPDDVVSAKEGLVQDEQVVRTLSDNMIAAYRTIEDLEGDPILILRIDTPRPIYTQGLASLRLFTGLAGLLVLTVGALSFLLFEAFIISRLARLAREIRRIGGTHNVSEQVYEGQEDELGRVARAVNRMLVDLATAESLEHTATAKVAAASEETKKQLTEIQKMNTLMIDRELKMVALKKEVDSLHTQVKKQN